MAFRGDRLCVLRRAGPTHMCSAGRRLTTIPADAMSGAWRRSWPRATCAAQPLMLWFPGQPCLSKPLGALGLARGLSVDARP